MDEGYTLANAQRFGWSSITGVLNPERVRLLEQHLVGPKVLDAGCGGGAMVEHLCLNGYKAVGLEMNQDFLRVAESRTRGEYFSGDVCHAPFPDKSFDSTYCIDVLEHVDDAAAIRELSRVTSKRLLFAVPRTDTILPNFGVCLTHYQDPTHLRTYTEKSFHQVLAENTPQGSLIEVWQEGEIHFAYLFAKMLRPKHGIWLWPLLRRVFPRLLRFFSFQKVYSGLQASVKLPSV